MASPFDSVPSFAAGGRNLNVIVETPLGSGWKFAFDAELGLFHVTGYLPAGMSFPFEFGFIPSTLADDGDPLDILLLTESPTFPGCKLEVRTLGVIEAQQNEKGRTVRNDRLIGVPVESRAHEKMHTLRDVGAQRLDEIETFFATYDSANEKTFEPLARRGPDVAHDLVLKAQAQARKEEPEVQGKRRR